MQNIKEKGLLIAKGFCMGSADVVPGVSGGTMAFILGIYTQLIDALKSFDLAWLQSVLHGDIKQALARPHFLFLIPLVIGILSALLFFTRVVSIPNLLKTEPELIYGLFFGLIAGSVLVLLRAVKEMRTSGFILLVLGISIGLVVFTRVPVETPESGWFIFMSGALAISAMILPGISGSFILLILNKYTYIFNALGYFNWSVIIPFGLGCVTGLIVFSRFLSYLLHHHYQRTISLIMGILIASFWLIWPFQERVYALVGSSEKLIAARPVFPQLVNATVASSIAMMVLGFTTVLVIHHYAGPTKTMGRT